LHQFLIASQIGRNRDQRRIERSCIGQPRASSSAASRSCLRDRMDQEAVRAFDRQDDRSVRREVA
jgi:hypothetical protein